MKVAKQGGFSRQYVSAIETGKQDVAMSGIRPKATMKYLNWLKEQGYNLFNL